MTGRHGKHKKETSTPLKKKSIRNLNEKPGSDTLITLRASGPVFCCYRFFQLPLPRLLLGDFSISDLRRMPMFDMENVQAAWEERDKEMLKVLLHGYVWNHIEG